jgi:hypothetical protein
MTNNECKEFGVEIANGGLESTQLLIMRNVIHIHILRQKNQQALCHRHAFSEEIQ